MSTGTRPVPTNLDNWPGVTDLVISYKHLLHVLWSSPGDVVSVIGVGRPGVIERLTGASRLDEPVVLEALRELDRRSLVAMDEQTREIGIRGWVRFHKFGGRWAKAAGDAYDQIQSPKIKGIWAAHEGVKALFPVKSKRSPPTATATATAERGAQGAPIPLSPGGDFGDLGEPGSGQAAPASPPVGAARYQASPDGVLYELGNVRDEAALAAISNYPPEARLEAVAEAARRDKGGVAYPSAALAILRASPNHQPPPQLAPWAIETEAKRRAYGLMKQHD